MVVRVPIFSVLGDALNFGARKMETILRLAWLPIVMMLVANMVLVFLVLSIANNRLISMTDVPSFAVAEAIAQQSITMGLMAGSVPIIAIVVGGFAINVLLVASFMAPLIRLAGKGEVPARGIINARLGPDQIRYILSGLLSTLTVLALALGPILVVSYFVMKHIMTALSKTYPHFPDEGSLHTMKIASGAEAMALRGEAWLYSYGIPGVVALPFFFGFLALLTWHFRPANRNSISAKPNWLLRALIVLAVWAFIVVGLPAILDMNFWKTAGVVADAERAEAMVFYNVLVGTALLIFFYFNLRMIPYQGIVVNRKSMAPAGLFSVSRGWNIVRLAVIYILLGLVLMLMLKSISLLLVRVIAPTVLILFELSSSYFKFTNGGEEATWVRSTAIWIWQIIQMVIDFFWAVFTYGVTAGMLGRFYRESERGASQAG